MDDEKRPQRLLYLVHQFYPEYGHGTEKFVWQLARTMQTRGHRVQVVTYQVKAPHRWARWLGIRVWRRNYTYAGIPVLALQLTNRPPRYHQQIDNAHQREFARRYLRRWRPDLVHVGHAMRMGGFVWAAQELGIPTVITLTDYWLICPKFTLLDSHGRICAGPAQGAACEQACPELDGAFIRQRLALAEQIARHAAAVIAPSQYLARVFQREWPWLIPQIVPHGIVPWTQNRKQYTPHSPLVFAHAGSLVHHKGVHVLIEAFRGVQSVTARLKIYGAGPDEAELRALAAGDSRVEFGGVYDNSNASQVFASVDVVVAPSLWSENRPFVVWEALAAGIPVIVSAAGGMPEAVAPGVTGLIVAPGNVAALRMTLQGIVDQPEQINAFKAAIRAAAIPTLTDEVDAYERIYRKVLDRQAPERGVTQ
jgi:glycosyltransferase involved in cell wall biosynthesis